MSFEFIAFVQEHLISSAGVDRGAKLGPKLIG